MLDDLIEIIFGLAVLRSDSGSHGGLVELLGALAS